MTTIDRGPQLAHLGIAVIDVDVMTAFYKAVLGLHVTDRGVGRTFKRELVFMSNSPDQHHQLVLASGRDPQHPSSVFQISFKVSSIDELRALRDRANAHGATAMVALNHGNALSLYFNDPEGNVVEGYLDTPFQISQPHGDPLDLEQPDAEIWHETENACRTEPSFALATDWAANFPNHGR